ncbi:unnamed protein product [Schistosoma rodhaini]|uniref:G_PROTEIN_RECEP_F2_4 domain-containing protein n=1 Tax=Schistosoma mansoni TaxID=6183 RepID=A0A5K4F7L3_SCHMA|nr:unnamed protein product [Schistosoma rodhaini]
MDTNILLCSNSFKNESDYYEGMNMSYCHATLNSIHQCWPPTLAGQFAKLPCPSNVTDFHYDENDDSFRECLTNGSWAEFADYSACTIIYPLSDEFFIFLCFLIGYIISMISVISGIFIFQYFRSLKCVRNNIHTHLMIAILLRASSWICLALINTTTLLHSQVVNNILTCVLAFGMIAVYSWMLIEGIHLMNILFLTFIVRRFRFTCYSIIGWGIPAALTCSWAIAKSVKLGHIHLWAEPTTSDPEGILVVTSILITLAVNFLIMSITLFMLLTKLHRQPTGIVGSRKTKDNRTIELQRQSSRGTCQLGLLSNNAITLSNKITTITMTALERANKSEAELRLNDKTSIQQDRIKTINNDNNSIITTNTANTKSNNHNKTNITAEIINLDAQTPIIPLKTIPEATTRIKTAGDSMQVTTGKKMQTKFLKSSSKTSSASLYSAAASITSANSNVSGTQPIKSDKTIIMKDKIINNKHTNNYNKKVCKNSSINRWKTSRHFQRKSIDSNFLSSPAIRIKEIRKAIKAIIFLMPLLGFSQLIFLIPYSKEFGRVFDYINAIMLSTQGFWVALIYCFLNSEVQRVLRTRWRILCSTLKIQPSGRIQQKQSFITNPILLSNNNYDTEHQF